MIRSPGAPQPGDRRPEWHPVRMAQQASRTASGRSTTSTKGAAAAKATSANTKADDKADTTTEQTAEQRAAASRAADAAPQNPASDTGDRGADSTPETRAQAERLATSGQRSGPSTPDQPDTPRVDKPDAQVKPADGDVRIGDDADAARANNPQADDVEKSTGEATVSDGVGFADRAAPDRIEQHPDVALSTGDGTVTRDTGSGNTVADNLRKLRQEQFDSAKTTQSMDYGNDPRTLSDEQRRNLTGIPRFSGEGPATLTETWAPGRAAQQRGEYTIPDKDGYIAFVPEYAKTPSTKRVWIAGQPVLTSYYQRWIDHVADTPKDAKVPDMTKVGPVVPSGLTA